MKTLSKTITLLALTSTFWYFLPKKYQIIHTDPIKTTNFEGLEFLTLKKSPEKSLSKSLEYLPFLDNSYQITEKPEPEPTYTLNYK